MTLNYRGLKYEANTAAVSAQPKPRFGMYRGVATDFAAASVGDRNPHALKYRGAAYAA